MFMTDPIADMLTRIRNAQAVGKETVEVPFSRLKYALAKIFEQAGIIQTAESKGRRQKKSVVLRLKYRNGEPIISGLKRISKPGQRVYASHQEFSHMKRAGGRLILSTSQGLMMEQEARKKNVGGEIICEIW
ncbi:30S ribosomal protein S8 [Patescibacteria group bacterium]|nr:30S ribosomal protein S8 [Patescibacteria group bacterium]